MGSRFGHDFGRVRVHTDARAAESARAVGALAYTLGDQVVFGAGQYAPAMTEGRRLLAHELSHVLQQRAAGGAAAGGSLEIEGPETAAEREAEAMAARIAGSEAWAGTVAAPARISAARASGLQRKVSPRLAEIERKLAAKKPKEKDVHDALMILKGLFGADLLDTVAAMARADPQEDLVERLLANVGDADKDAEFETLQRIKNAWPRSVTTTVGSTTVTTTVVGSCSPDQYQQVYTAAQTSLQWLDRAIARSDAYLAKPGDVATADVRAALELHFQNTTDRVAHHVRERLAHIRDDIRGAVPFSIECHGIWDKLCDVAMAYVRGRDMVVFCNSFFGSDAVTQAEAVVHEMAHAQVGGVYITDRGYASERVLKFLSTAEALTNAESYGLFVQQLGTGKVPSRPAPKDKREDCPKDWWDWIQFAIAHAQRWNANARLTINSLTAAHVKNWDAKLIGYLGGTSQAAIDAAKKAYETLKSKLSSPINFECESLGGGRCDDPGTQTYWFEFWSDFHICPLWRYQRTPDDHVVGLLSGLYGYLAGVDDNTRRWGYAMLAKEWAGGGQVPSLTEVLGSGRWISEALTIRVTPIEPKTPPQVAYDEDGRLHQRMSHMLPVYQGPAGQASQLPFRCRVEFLVDFSSTPRPAPFTPPRVSASLAFRSVSGNTIRSANEDARPVYAGAGRPLSTRFGSFLDMTFTENGPLKMEARLEDPDTRITRVYDDTIQIEADRSAGPTAAAVQAPQVEGCTGWEKNPEGFIQQITSYVAVHEINPVMDTNARLAGCQDPHECAVTFPNGLSMTVIWSPGTQRVLAKWDDQGGTTRRVYAYSCAVGKVTLTPLPPPSAPALKGP